MPDKTLRLGLDIGSTTIKTVVLSGEKLIYKTYARHHSDMRKALVKAFADLRAAFPTAEFQMAITGSGGMKVAEALHVPFVQEVIAQSEFVSKYYPQSDVIIELGGEDAKITFLKPHVEQRMNGACAGGTGSFIDQMAQLMDTDAQGLNELAKDYQNLYSIASRCGVFAKSDMQPLLNEGAPRADLAASVLDAVVKQSITALAQGRSIRGHVVFLGGPLYFLSELRQAFKRSLEGQVTSFTLPEDAQVVVAKGAALLSGDSRTFKISELEELLEQQANLTEEVTHLPPLFANKQERTAFLERHAKARVEELCLEDLEGPAFLGIDAGSTTTKAVLLDAAGQIYFSSYGSNLGSPVDSSLKILHEIYERLPSAAYIARACVTGYGEALIQTALKLDEGCIETMAHYKAAQFFQPDVDFIVDIGGQDMKCMQIEDGVIYNIMLNEACSSGCGSFIQTFAHSLGLSVPDFAEAALQAQKPVDLGTRCTVFMNSRVKQAQKEGASVGDISAGLAYSVVRNALYKVIKIQDPTRLGQKIVVQGGTFLNDSVLRSFEKIMGREVIRPNIAGLMGAFGAALHARAHWKGGEMHSTILGPEELSNFKMQTRFAHCGRCGNNCKLTISQFNDGTRFISGNRCERGAGHNVSEEVELPNLYAYKYRRLFEHYQSLDPDKAPRGVLGLPRVLNMYEDYPFWHCFFSELGFSVQLSSPSSHELFAKGLESIPSESICYPAKLVHGHIEDLIARGIKTIFYPSLTHEYRENPQSDNHYNCPIVVSYPEVIANNLEHLKSENIKFISPFLPFDKPSALAHELSKALADYAIPPRELEAALDKAYAERAAYKEDVLREGDRVRAWLKEHGRKAIVLAGRPYHVDPEINHGLPELINSLGLGVLSEDSIARPGSVQRPLRVVDQWAYHARLYEAAAVVLEDPTLELVQLNSFGCGLDAVTTDQVKEILDSQGRIYTCLKIDEINNLGAARIRLRSLLAAVEEREAAANTRPLRKKRPYTIERRPFTKEMQATHTILAPQMAPTQFALLEAAMEKSRMQVKLLPKVSKADVECGLKYVNNDACFPAIIVIGQLVNALQSGAYDVEHTSVLITQTGGGCRATNYTAFLRKALREAGFAQVSVIAVSVQGLEGNPGIQLSPLLMRNLLQACILGDLLDSLLSRVRPYEQQKGAADALCAAWLSKAQNYLRGESKYSYRQLVNDLIDDFEAFPLQDIPRKPRVGLVGEILVKFHPDANNQVVRVIEDEGCEAVMPNLLDFFLYCCYNAIWRAENLGGKKITAVLAKMAIQILEFYRKPVRQRLEQSTRFRPITSVYALADSAREIMKLGHATGEGWFLTGEMIELIKDGVPNIICAQPFACLPNHVVGKGMLKAVRQKYPEANIVPVDYDPGASEVNQLNRIKLMIAGALKREATLEERPTF